MNRELLKKLVLEVLEKDSEAETHIPDEPEEESEFEEQEFGLDTKEHGLKEYGGKLKIVNETFSNPIGDEDYPNTHVRAEKDIRGRRVLTGDLSAKYYLGFSKNQTYRKAGNTHGLTSHAIKHIKIISEAMTYVTRAIGIIISYAHNSLQNCDFYIFEQGEGNSSTVSIHSKKKGKMLTSTDLTTGLILNMFDMLNDENHHHASSFVIPTIIPAHQSETNKLLIDLKGILNALAQAYDKKARSFMARAIDLDSLTLFDGVRALRADKTVSFKETGSGDTNYGNPVTCEWAAVDSSGDPKTYYASDRVKVKLKTRSAKASASVQEMFTKADDRSFKPPKKAKPKAEPTVTAAPLEEKTKIEKAKEIVEGIINVIFRVYPEQADQYVQKKRKEGKWPAGGLAALNRGVSQDPTIEQQQELYDTFIEVLLNDHTTKETKAIDSNYKAKVDEAFDILITDYIENLDEALIERVLTRLLLKYS